MTYSNVSSCASTAISLWVHLGNTVNPSVILLARLYNALILGFRSQYHMILSESRYGKLLAFTNSFKGRRNSLKYEIDAM